MRAFLAGLALTAALPGLALAQGASFDRALKVTTVAKLPKAPAGSGEGSAECSAVLQDPQTAAGKLAKRLGWSVVSEAKLGSLDLVSFAPNFEPGTSGSCLVKDGNIGVFDGEALRKLIYVPKGVKTSIGSLDAVSGGVRIWDGDYLAAPVADLVLAKDGADVALRPLAAQDKVCNGAGTVPNVYGKSIDVARRSVIAAGWTPRPNPNDPKSHRDRYGREADLAAAGMIEVDTCSGTGFGFCAFLYRQGDMELQLTTAGEDDPPGVAGYSVQCDRSKWTEDRKD